MESSLNNKIKTRLSFLSILNEQQNNVKNENEIYSMSIPVINIGIVFFNGTKRLLEQEDYNLIYNLLNNLNKIYITGNKKTPITVFEQYFQQYTKNNFINLIKTDRIGRNTGKIRNQVISLYYNLLAKKTDLIQFQTIEINYFNNKISFILTKIDEILKTRKVFDDDFVNQLMTVLKELENKVIEINSKSIHALDYFNNLIIKKINNKKGAFLVFNSYIKKDNNNKQNILNYFTSQKINERNLLVSKFDNQFNIRQSLSTQKPVDTQPAQTTQPDVKPKKPTYRICHEWPLSLYCINKAVRNVQQVLGVKTDGYLGPKTLNATENFFNNIGKVKDFDKNIGITYDNYNTIIDSSKLMYQGTKKTPTSINENEDIIQLEENILNTFYSAIKDGFSGAAGDMLREYIIRYFLGLLNLNTKLAEGISTVLAQYDIRRLIKIFKSKNDCLTESAPLVDVLSEVIIGQMQLGSEKTSGFLGRSVRNLFGEAIQKSNFGEESAKLICEAIWKEDKN